MAMASKDENEMHSLFHGDILPEMLVWLDVRTLARCQCVCKAWKEAIADPGFLEQHRHRSSQRPRLLLFRQPDGRGNTRLITFDPTQATKTGRAAELGTVVVPFISEPELYSFFVQGCGGDLMCCHCDSKCIHLFNPRTGQFSTLPKLDQRFRYCSHVNVGLVFGYVSSKREYVVVTLGTSNDTNLQARKLFFAPDNASFDSASWLEIGDTSPFPIETADGVLVGDSVYWAVWSPESEDSPDSPEEKSIISLALEEDKFEIIGYPPGWEPRGRNKRGAYHDYHFQKTSSMGPLIELKGNLYLLNGAHTPESESNVLEMWAFIKSGSCWVKEYEIRLDFMVRQVSATATSEGELILHSSEDGGQGGSIKSYYLLNPETEKTRLVVQFYSRRRGCRLKQFVGVFWDSFFSMGGGRESCTLKCQPEDWKR